MENKEYMEYQQKIKENRAKNKDRVIKEIYDWLIKHDINLSEVSSVIVEKKGILCFDINVYTKIRGRKRWIYKTDNTKITNLLEKHRDEIEERVGVSIHCASDFVGIPFLTETLLETWEIDCTGIK